MSKRRRSLLKWLNGYRSDDGHIIIVGTKDGFLLYLTTIVGVGKTIEEAAIDADKQIGKYARQHRVS